MKQLGAWGGISGVHKRVHKRINNCIVMFVLSLVHPPNHSVIIKDLLFRMQLYPLHDSDIAS